MLSQLRDLAKRSTKARLSIAQKRISIGMLFIVLKLDIRLYKSMIKGTIHNAASGNKWPLALSIMDHRDKCVVANHEYHTGICPRYP